MSPGPVSRRSGTSAADGSAAMLLIAIFVMFGCQSVRVLFTLASCDPGGAV